MSFEERYKKLNAAQKKAVDTIEGPVLVVAGPGSGKTEILSMRVARILQETDTAPNSVLCLTFTDSASINMRERLSGLIGASAYRVGIYTFHSFCTEVIARYPEYFFGHADFHPADDVTRREILENLFVAMSYDNPLRSEHPEQGFVFLKSALSAFSDLKRAGLRPHEFEEILSHNIRVLEAVLPLFKKYIPERVSKNDRGSFEELLEEIKKIKVPKAPFAHISSLKDTLLENLSTAIQQAEELGTSTPLSEWKRKEVEKREDSFVPKDLARMDRMRALATLYKDYSKTLFDAGYFDFDDMILQVVTVCEENETLAQILQERFQYVLVDEFQDTNDAQMRLLYALTSAAVHEGRPNIMAVGDDDQSIYRFQGAEVANMHAFVTHFRDPVLVSLNTNYRSIENILELSEAVISQSAHSLRTLLPQIEKKIVSHRGHVPEMPVHLKTLDTALHEYAYITEEIVRLKNIGIALSDITVISRTHRALQDLVPYLHHAGIAVTYEKRKNIFSDEIVSQVLTLLRFIDSISGTENVVRDDLLPRILSFPCWNISHTTVWQISLEASKKNITWLEVMKSHEDPKVHGLAGFLISLGVRSQSEPAERIIDLIIGAPISEVQHDAEDEFLPHIQLEVSVDDYQSPLRQYYFGSGQFEKNKVQYIEFLSALKVFIEALREYRGGQVVSVKDALRFVDVHQSAGIELLDQSMYSDSGSAVTLLTSHKAKGMEFPVVFVMSVSDDIWSGRGVPDRLPFPKNITVKASADSTDDKIRLLYVAITRAKERLYLTHHKENGSGKKVLLSEFLQKQAPLFEEVVPEKSIGEILSVHVSRAPVLSYGAEEYSLLAHVLQGYQMPVTHLNNFLNVVSGGPHLFFEQNLLRFPQAKTASSVYGTALHSALEYVYMHAKREGKIPKISDVVKRATGSILSGRLSPADTRVQSERAEKALTSYMKQYGDSIDPKDLIETSFKHSGVCVGEVSVTGKIDKMHIEGAEIVVSDWKTGRAKESWEVSDKDQKVQLHSYARQLLFYKILVEGSHDFAGHTVKEGRLEFLEPVKEKVRSGSEDVFIILPLTLEEEAVERVKKLIEVVYRKIMKFDFPDTSGYSKDLGGIIAFEDDLLEGRV